MVISNYILCIIQINQVGIREIIPVCIFFRSIFRGDNIIRLVPLDLNPTLGCSSKASVFSLSNEKVRKIAIIFAEDSNSGETIRCDVIVDTIASLQIVSKTKELFVGDAPELFEVSAFDDQGTYFINFYFLVGT